MAADAKKKNMPVARRPRGARAAGVGSARGGAGMGGGVAFSPAAAQTGEGAGRVAVRRLRRS